MSRKNVPLDIAVESGVTKCILQMVQVRAQRLQVAVALNRWSARNTGNENALRRSSPKVSKIFVIAPNARPSQGMVVQRVINFPDGIAAQPCYGIDSRAVALLGGVASRSTKFEVISCTLRSLNRRLPAWLWNCFAHRILVLGFTSSKPLIIVELVVK